MTTKKWYRIDVSVVNLNTRRTEWREVGIAHGVQAAAHLRRQYRRFVTRRVEIPPPEWSRPTPRSADAVPPRGSAGDGDVHQGQQP